MFVSVLVVLAGCTSTPPREFVAPIFPPPPDEPRIIFERSLISSADVEEFTAQDKFKMFATGTGKEARGLSKPFGVAVHHGRVYVTDTVQNAVAMFDIPGKRFKLIGTEGRGAVGKPLGIDVAGNGELYVCDISGKRVVVYDAEGNYLRSIGGKDQLERPSGVAVNREGTRLYVADTGGVTNDKHRIQVFDALTGELIKSIGKRGTEPGDFNLPTLLSTDAEGNVYVIDSGNFRVEKFSANGEFKMEFGKVGRNLGDFARPKGIDVDKEGNIYVVDTAFGNYQIFDKEGKLLLFVGNRTDLNEPAKYVLPADIEVDEDGRIYVVEQFFRRIDVFRPYTMKAEEGFAGVGKSAK